MEERDIDKISDIHMLIRPKETTMITRFGRNFCYELIGLIYKTEPGCCFVAEQKQNIVGYLLGTSDSKKLNKRIIMGIGPLFIPKLIARKYVISENFDIILYLIYYLLKHSINKSIKAEEIEIGVLSEGRRRGIASLLVKKFFSYLKSKDIKNAKVSAYKKEIQSIKFHSNFYTPIHTEKTPIGYIVHFAADLKDFK